MRQELQRLRTVKWLLFALDSLWYGGLFLFFCGFPNSFGVVLGGGILYVALILSLYAFNSYHYAKMLDLYASFLGVWAASFVGILVSYVTIKVFSLSLELPWIPFFFLFSGALFGSRWMGSKFFRCGSPSTPVLVVGNPEECRALVEELSSSFLRKLIPCGYAEPRRDSLEQILEEHEGVSTVLVATPAFFEASELREYSRQLKSRGIDIIFLPILAEKCLGRIPLSVASSFGSYYSIAFEAIEPRPSERVMSLLIAFLGIFLTLPLMILVALVIYLESRGPVLFRQERIGLNGSFFTLYKFRTMRVGEKSEEGDIKRDEQRLTRVGRFLRKTRLDEFPQFWNVLKNDMNIVGPRPEMPKYVDMCAHAVPFYLSRHNLRPGITGWAQVNYRYTTDLVSYKRKTEYDLYYVKNQSLLLDLQIILKTIETVLVKKGSS